jgi:hypothetical protein
MEQFDVFTVRDLRKRTGDLMRDAEAGRLALITKHGRPKFLVEENYRTARRLDTNKRNLNMQ